MSWTRIRSDTSCNQIDFGIRLAVREVLGFESDIIFWGSYIQLIQQIVAIFNAFHLLNFPPLSAFLQTIFFKPCTLGLDYFLEFFVYFSPRFLIDVDWVLEEINVLKVLNREKVSDFEIFS